MIIWKGNSKCSIRQDDIRLLERVDHIDRNVARMDAATQVCWPKVIATRPQWMQVTDTTSETDFLVFVHLGLK